MTAATSAASTPSLAARVGKAVRVLAARAVAVARAGAVSAIGVVGLALIAVGAGMVYLPAGFIVGGVLAVFLSARLDDGGA